MCQLGGSELLLLHQMESFPESSGFDGDAGQHFDHSIYTGSEEEARGGVKCEQGNDQKGDDRPRNCRRQASENDAGEEGPS